MPYKSDATVEENYPNTYDGFDPASEKSIPYPPAEEAAQEAQKASLDDSKKAGQPSSTYNIATR